MKSLPSTSVKCAFLPLSAQKGYAVGGTSGAGLKCPGMPHGMTLGRAHEELLRLRERVRVHGVRLSLQPATAVGLQVLAHPVEHQRERVDHGDPAPDLHVAGDGGDERVELAGQEVVGRAQVLEQDERARVRELALDRQDAGGPADETHGGAVRQHLDDDGAVREPVAQRHALGVVTEQHGDGEGGGVQRQQRVHREVPGMLEQFVGGREVVRHAVGERRELLREEPQLCEPPDRDGLPLAVEHLVEMRRGGEGEPDARAGPAGCAGPAGPSGLVAPRRRPDSADAAGEADGRARPAGDGEPHRHARVRDERPHLRVVAHHVLEVGQDGEQVESRAYVLETHMAPSG